MKKNLILILSIWIILLSVLVACDKIGTKDLRANEITIDNTYIFKTDKGFNLALKEGEWWPILSKEIEPRAFKIIGTAMPEYFYIYDYITKRVMEVNGGKKDNGVKINMWDLTGADNQFFVIMSTKEAYKKYLKEDDKNYDKGKENEFIFVTSNNKFFTDSEEGPITGDNPVNACHFAAYIVNKE